jgi:hypothetical protein
VLAEVATSANCTRSGVSTNRATGPAVCTVLRIKSTFHSTTLAASRSLRSRASLSANSAASTSAHSVAAIMPIWPASMRSANGTLVVMFDPRRPASLTAPVGSRLPRPGALPEKELIEVVQEFVITRPSAFVAHEFGEFIEL